MEVRVVAVHSVAPVIVDAVVAGVQLRAEWIGPDVRPGDIVDVELDIDGVLVWNDTIAVTGVELPPREGVRLAGTVEDHEPQLLTLRIAGGLVQVEVDNYPEHIPSGTAVVLVAEDLKLYPTGI